MDLGATLCVRSRPLCPACPLAEQCVARIEGRQSALPTPRPKKLRPQRSAYVVLMVRDDGAVLLERRPPAGIWGGLWTLPQFDAREAAQAWIPDGGVDSLPPYFHSFTHFDLTLHPLLVRGMPAPAALGDSDRYCWYEPRQPARIGLAKPAVELIRSLDAQPTAPAQRQSTLL
jgi:A/G-specific adenine glycosylase